MKLVHGFGINDADYKVCELIEFGKKGGKRTRKLKKMCPYYSTWKGMLRRCYSEKFQEYSPSYRGCVVCEDWLTFSKFKTWMEKQTWEGKHLDKDILGNGKLYSPDSCCFVPLQVNNFLLFKRKLDNSTFYGVHFANHANKYRASISNLDGYNVKLGYFEDQLSAYEAWWNAKIELCHLLAERYSLEDKIRDGLLGKIKEVRKDSSK